MMLRLTVVVAAVILSTFTISALILIARHLFSILHGLSSNPNSRDRGIAPTNAHRLTPNGLS
ncbi:MAG TPA: hypothetical protein VKA00_09080 [Trueperaceae bacterium]|nr:hypothetical protein [Trueperaceae bacterium]